MGHAARELDETHAKEPEASPSPSGDVVRCVMSGAWVPRAEAIMVTLGPGRRRWIHRDFTNADR